MAIGIAAFAIFTLSFAFANAQGTQKVTISGKVIEEGSKEPLQYVNVALLGAKNKLVNGISTDEKGNFLLHQGKGQYKVRLTFIGYKDTIFALSVGNSGNINLGSITMRTSTSTLKGVEITAERSMMEYKLDKRVINVDKNLVSAGGSASDVLENVPSVSVDEDGTVSLRGNSNVKILIDGKPSELLGNDLATVLAQIPASTIDNVEVITNPSAKYDPEGMSGIINIKLKEKGNKGLSGNVSVSSGSALQKWQPKSNLSTGLTYSTKKFALNASIDARYEQRSHYRDQIKTLFGSTASDPIDAFIYSNREDSHNMAGGGFKIGGDWFINDKNTLTLSYNGRLNASPGDDGTITNTDLWNANSRRTFTQTDNGDDHGFFHTLAMNYTKKFDKKDQELSIDANFNHGNFNRQNTELIDYTANIADYKLKDEDKDSFNRIVATVNYAHPFTKDLKLEVGYNLNYGKSNSDYNYYTNDNPSKDTTSYIYKNEEAINAFYGTLGWNIGKFSTQVGFRYEIVRTTGTKTMDYETSTSNIGNHFNKDYNSLFPSLHLSYAITPMQSAQISYSRRIQRPDPWNLMPNVDLSNPEQIRFGNPNLNPEYTNSFELGYSIIFPKTTIFASAYYRQTNDRIGWFSFLWTEENARMYGFDWALEVAGEDTTRLAQTSMNIAKSSNYGLELIIDQQIASWWKLNVNANIFGSYQDGTSINANKVRSLNMNCKLNSTMTIKKDWIIQLSAQYYAPQKTIQGDMKAQIFSDLAIKHNILDKKGTLSLSFRDIFNTRARVSRTLTQDYFTYTYSKGYSQIITLNFSYLFGQNNIQKQQKKPKQTENVSSGLESNGEDY
jgi:Outer membrane receptor proteins, mostly Fe transport